MKRKEIHNFLIKNNTFYLYVVRKNYEKKKNMYEKQNVNDRVSESQVILKKSYDHNTVSDVLTFLLNGLKNNQYFKRIKSCYRFILWIIIKRDISSVKEIYIFRTRVWTIYVGEVHILNIEMIKQIFSLHGCKNELNIIHAFSLFFVYLLIYNLNHVYVLVLYGHVKISTCLLPGIECC